MSKTPKWFYGLNGATIIDFCRRFASDSEAAHYLGCKQADLKKWCSNKASPSSRRQETMRSLVDSVKGRPFVRKGDEVAQVVSRKATPTTVRRIRGGRRVDVPLSSSRKAGAKQEAKASKPEGKPTQKPKKKKAEEVHHPKPKKKKAKKTVRKKRASKRSTKKTSRPKGLVAKKVKKRRDSKPVQKVVREDHEVVHSGQDKARTSSRLSPQDHVTICDLVVTEVIGLIQIGIPMSPEELVRLVKKVKARHVREWK